ncbi:MAG: ROK family protein [Propionivibrio sp.]
MKILGIDVGGTGIKSAIVETTTGELISERHRIVTPKPATPMAVGDALKDVLKHHEWTGPVGMGFPAAIQHGIARTASNIDKSFIGLPITEYFRKQTGLPFHIANDADVAGMAEMRFGAGKGNDGVVLIITIGTGLGTALFSEGHLQPNTELGHVYLENGHEAERYASEAVRVTKDLKWKEWGERLNLYLSTMENLLWPDRIILGGGVSEKLHKFSPMITTKAPVVAASFLNQAGIVGAALFAEKEMKKP